MDAASSWEFVSSMSLRDFFGVIRRNLMLLVIGGLVTAVPIAVMVIRQAPSYRAEALIRLVDARGAMTGASPLADQVLSRNSDAILSQIEVLRGREVIGAVVDQEGLRLTPVTSGFAFSNLREIRVAREAPEGEIYLAFYDDGVRAATGPSGEVLASAAYGAPLALNGVQFVVPQRPEVETAVIQVLHREAAIDAVLDVLETTPRERTDAVAIAYKAADPETARRVTNTIVNTYQRMNAESAQEESRRQRIFLEQQLAVTDSMLRAAEEVLTGFRTEAQVYSSRDRVVAQQQALLDLEAQREALTEERRRAADLLGQFQAMDGPSRSGLLRTLVSSPSVGSNQAVMALYAQLTSYERQRDSLSTQATARNPQLVTLNNLIDGAQRDLAAAIGSALGGIDVQISALTAVRNRTSAELSMLPEAEIEDVRLMQEVEAIRRVSDQLRADLHRARMAEAVEVGQVQIVYEAPLPLEPMSKGLAWKLGLGLILGLLLGSGGAVLRESMNTSIRQPQEIEASLGLPGLAVVPQAAPDARFARVLNGREVGRVGPNGRPELTMLHDAAALGAEAYRMLRTNLLYAQSTGQLNTLVVTSAAPREGKTTTVANLAIAFAQQGQRVLLVDCDLRRPRLHKVFRATMSPGLADVLSGEATLRAALQPTLIDELTLMTAGAMTQKPAELLGSERMHQLLQFLADGFDLVLLDTPPVLAASETMSLSRLADGVVLVVRAGQTDRREARHALRQLTDVGAAVVGAVLNDPDSTTPKYSGGYSYYKYYSSSAS